MLRTEAQLKNYPFFTLLSFERDTDPVFVRTDGARAKLDQQRSHTGMQSLQVPAGARSMVVHLSPLHSGRDWPADWTLVGAYFLTQQPQRLTASYEAGGSALATYTVQLPAGQWTPVLIDIAAALDGRPAQEVGTLRFTFGAGLSQPVWCDDVLEMNNSGTLVDSGPSMLGWTIRERGFQYQVEKKGAFRMVLKTPEASDQGWRIDECDEIRARFASPGGGHTRLVYADGREYLDGKFHVLDARLAEQLTEQEAAPAQISVPQTMGRLERNSSGDENNDGYSERTGAYQIVASGPRLEMQIAPRSLALVNPVLEIAGLPAGKVLVSMEGKLVERIVRLGDGRVLVQLPGEMIRAVAVSVRVEKSE